MAGIQRNRRHTLRWTALVAFAMLAIVLGVGSASAQGSKGADFWLTFPSNYTGGGALTLFIAGDPETSGTVSIAGLDFSADFTVPSSGSTSVALPSGAEIRTSGAAVDNGIHVTADNAQVTVYGLDEIRYSTDAYLGLPTDALGTDYIALGYGGAKQADLGNLSELAIVATEDGTAVTIKPATALVGHQSGAAFQVFLNQGQTYQLQGTDVSGTLISSSAPVSVFSGAKCADIPNPLTFSCNHLVEQLPPTSEWGRHFLSLPLATRLKGDTFRILASEDNTTVQLNGSPIATLNRAQFTEQTVTTAASIDADKPVLVMQYSNGTDFDGVAASDPSEMMIPPHEQFVDSYTVVTPPASETSPFENYLNVIAPNEAVDGGILLDDEPISSDAFTAIGDSGFSGAQVSVTPGSHTLSGSSPFGVQSYGFSTADAYSYPGGFAIAGAAQVASVTLAPKTGTSQVSTAQCVTATVKDDGGNPLQEISVDFEATGANTAGAFGFTDGSGQAQFCYSGANAGTDTITGTVGSLSDTATRTWTPGPAAGIPAKSDVAVALAVPKSVRIGQAVTFTATVSNGGVDSATGVVLRLTVPAGSTFKSASLSNPNLCAATATTVSCPVGTLTPGGSALATIALTATQVGPLTATASAVADFDTNGANNSSSATTTVLSLTAPPLPPPPPTEPGTFNAIGVGAINVNGVDQAPDQVFTLNSGNTVDVSQGAVTLTAVDGSYASFSAVQFTAARSLSARSTSAAAAVPAKFKVTSGAVTVLTLVGGNFAVCNTPRSLTATNTTPVRQLWGSAKGNFQTKSRYSSATVRGTIWFTQDRCDGSLTSVVQGVVDVLDTSLNKTFAVGPGQSHLALKKSFKPPTVKKKAKKKAKVQTAAVYTVRAGDSLWAIAAAKLGSGGRWTEIARLNRLSPPYSIPAGTRLKLPRR